MTEIIRLCPASRYQIVCSHVSCANATSVCAMMRVPWAGICKVPLEHAVTKIANQQAALIQQMGVQTGTMQ